MRPMKDSGVEWIGEIPEEWEVFPVRYAFTEVKDKNLDGSVSNALQFKFGNIIPKKNFEADSDNYVADTILNYTIVEPRVIMINGLNLNYDFKTIRVGIVKEKGVITSAYLAIKANENIINAEFAMYLFRGYEVKMAFHNMGVGIRLTLGFSEFRDQPMLLPPMTEQNRIVAYLDTKCAKIDALIAKQQAIIEKLKAYKLSVITEAVTKGLNPDVPMKESGVEWIGEIPVHWYIHKFCWDYAAMLGKMLDAKRISGDNLHPYIKNVNVQWFQIDCNNLDQMDFEEDETERYSVQPGDLMICEGGEIGKCAIIPDDFPQGIYYQKALHRVRKRTENSGNVEFLSYLMFCMAKNECFDTSPEKATIAHLPGDALSQLRLPSPPIAEQKEIVDYLNRKCHQIEEAIEAKQKIIDKLTEYKKSLIYEVVTGKREV